MAEAFDSEPKRIKLDHEETEQPSASVKNVECPATSTSSAETQNPREDHKPLLGACAQMSTTSHINVNEVNGVEVEKPVGEVDVGITEYISMHEGFQGIIKHRYSDFHVNEIDLNGQKVSLTDISQPESDKNKAEEVKVDDVLTTAQITSLEELTESTEPSKDVLITVGDDKHQRGLIHAAIRNKFPALESSTNSVDGVRTIVVSKSKEKDARGRKNTFMKRKAPWSHPGMDYCHFCLYKENMDTMQAVNVLSRHLGVRPNTLTYCGTKDRRAKTCQRISAYRYCKEPLNLGDLKGNNFVIILRKVTGSSEQISQGMESLKSVGFINYFGMQRFGTSSVPTHMVGKALLKSNWQEAVELIMKPRAGSNNTVSTARIFWWKFRDAAKALEMMRKEYCPERHLLNGLKIRPENDLVGALSFIPRNQRTMYVHAYQSYIWNKMVSQRFKKYRLDIMVGDLVIKAGSLAVDCDEGESGEKKQFVQPSYVTEENLPDYTIHDVVMPLPGYDVLYPQNDTGEGYLDLLEEDGLTPQDLKHKVKDYSLRGQYRHIVVKPAEVSWKSLTYDDDSQSLVLSDLERLQNVKLPESNLDGKNAALKIELSLPSSTYATMALREVLKQDTSAAHQSKLTAEYKTQPTETEGEGVGETRTSGDSDSEMADT